MARAKTIVLDHVACGVRSIDEAGALLELELGADAHRGGPGIGFRGGQWQFEGEARLELIEPFGEPGGFLHRFLERSGPGIHHVTFKVPDIHAARERATALGYEVVGFRDDSPSWKECFLHPKQAGGIVVQMAEADPDADEGNWLPIPRVTSGTAPRRAVLRGVRLVARDAGRMRRLWVELLGGREERESATRSVVGWPDSPLKIFVTIDPSAEMEGPVGLVFAPFDAAAASPLRELLGAPLVAG